MLGLLREAFLLKMNYKTYATLVIKGLRRMLSLMRIWLVIRGLVSQVTFYSFNLTLSISLKMKISWDLKLSLLQAIKSTKANKSVKTKSFT